MSSSSGSDSSDDDDEALEREVSQLRSAIAANPSAYDSYLQLIAAQRKIGDLDGVRAAREQMAAIFPLTVDIWTPWLEDEARLASTEAERRAVRLQAQHLLRQGRLLGLLHQLAGTSPSRL